MSADSGRFFVSPADMCDLCFPWMKKLSKTPEKQDDPKIKKVRRLVVSIRFYLPRGLQIYFYRNKSASPWVGRTYIEYLPSLYVQDLESKIIWYSTDPDLSVLLKKKAPLNVIPLSCYPVLKAEGMQLLKKSGNKFTSNLIVFDKVLFKVEY